MMLNALNRSIFSIMQHHMASRHKDAGGQRWLFQRRRERPLRQQQVIEKRTGTCDARPQLRVEEMEVSADRKYMYCKGCVRSQGLGSRPDVVVAVEWLDSDHKALNTDWKRIEMNLDGAPLPLLPGALRSFVVRAPLDRRVKWVKAYAFSGNQRPSAELGV